MKEPVQGSCGICPASSRWISVIDPDPMVRDMLRELLGELKAEVRTYEAAEPFLVALRGQLPTCLISEVRLPAMSGVALLRHLKSLGKAVPAILLATDPDVSLAVEIIKEGALEFVEKPIVDDRIARLVSALLSLEELRVAAQGKSRIPQRTGK